MNKEQQNLAWKSIPKEIKNEILVEYHQLLHNPRLDKYDSVYLTAFENIFGQHNLIPVEKSRLCDKCAYNCCNICSGQDDRLMAVDDRISCDKHRPKPKFHKCQKIVMPSGRVELIEDYHFENGVWSYLVGDPAQWISEHHLEPFDNFVPKFSIGDRVIYNGREAEIVMIDVENPYPYLIVPKGSFTTWVAESELEYPTE